MEARLLERRPHERRRCGPRCCLMGLILSTFFMSVTTAVAFFVGVYHSPLFNTEPGSGDAPSPHGIRGVNLGGWLVLEPWITPSLFYPFLCPEAGCSPDAPPVIDEQSFCERLGADEARRRLRIHREGWVTEHTFARLEAIGLNGGAVPPALAQRLRRLHSSQKHLLNGVLFNRVKVRTDDRTPTLRSLWI